MDTVCVFMSTYNGEKYIREQIDSILNQQNVQVILCIRDDGSQDHTVAIIQEYIKHGENIVLQEGENVGLKKSFALVSHTHIEADYYAFSDQDDVWKNEKLICAVEALKAKTLPTLLGGNFFITDKHLNKVGKWAETEEDLTRLRSLIQRGYALGYNMYGCSMVWNRALQDLVEQYFPEYLTGQDVYLTILAGAVGEIVIDGRPMFFHRLHQSNTAGIETHFVKRIKKGYRLYWGKERTHLNQIAQEVIENYNERINIQHTGVNMLYHVAAYHANSKAKMALLTAKELKLIRIPRRLFVMIRIIFNKL